MRQHVNVDAAAALFAPNESVCVYSKSADLSLCFYRLAPRKSNVSPLLNDGGPKGTVQHVLLVSFILRFPT